MLTHVLKMLRPFMWKHFLLCEMQ